ncbi:hypothetical protein Trydic_g16399 [Trypoxylus dichotomus]
MDSAGRSCVIAQWNPLNIDVCEGKSNDQQRERQQEVELVPPSVVEVKNAIGALIVSRGKAPGRNIYEEEKAPQEWNKATTCRIYKKGGKLPCKNYRGISLLNTGYRAFTYILNPKLNLLPSIRHDSEKEDLQAIRYLQSNRYYVNIGDQRSLCLDTKPVYGGVQYHARLKAGERLTATLFNLVLKYIVRGMQMGRTNFLTNKTTQLAAYADDINIFSRTSKDVIEMYEQLKEISKSVGPNINMEKTEVMLQSRAGTNSSIQSLMEDTLEAVNQFMYLGTEIFRNGFNDCNGQDRMAKRRIPKKLLNKGMKKARPRYRPRGRSGEAIDRKARKLLRMTRKRVAENGETWRGMLKKARVLCWAVEP